jgi:hypothetical protein
MKYKGIEQEELNIPEWQKKLVQERIENYQSNPNSAQDFNAAMDEIEKGL